MSILINFSITFFFINCIYAVSAPPVSYTVEQPDGAIIPVKMFGHEYYSLIETLDGYVIDWIEDEARLGWYYKSLNSDNNFITTSIKVVYPTPEYLYLQKNIREISPSVKKHIHHDINEMRSKNSHLNKSLIDSTFKPLIFLVDFNSLPSGMPEKKYSKEQFKKLLFEEQLDSDGSLLPSSYDMSVRDYYFEISNGMLEINGGLESVVDWMTADNSYSYYVDSEQGTGVGSNGLSHSAAALVVELAMKIESDYDFQDYDGNLDGDLDCIILIVEGWGNGDDDQFWPHMSFIHSGANGIGSINGSAPINNQGYFSLDGVAIKKYIVIPEQFHMNYFEINKNDIHPIGTISHEIGHVLGLPDLYDTSVNSAAGIGQWGLMGSGNWKRQTSPAYMGAWSRYKLGFINPQIIENVDGIDEILVNPINQEINFSAMLLPLTSHMPQEYLLIENRQKQGTDQHLQESGLLVWHVDETITGMYPAMNSVNTNPDHYGVNLLQADGLGDLYTGSGSADSKDPFPGSLGIKSISPLTIPNTLSYRYDRDGDGDIDSESNSGVYIKEISEDIDGTIHFNITNLNTLGKIIGYDEGGYNGISFDDTYESLQWAGIRFKVEENNILSGIQTVFPPSTWSWNVSDYVVNIWEGWKNNKPQNLLLTYNSNVSWTPENFRDGGWVFIPFLNEKIIFSPESEYYVEINYNGVGGVYPFDKGIYFNSNNNNMSYYRSNTSESCKSLTDLGDADWNIRVVVSSDENLSSENIYTPKTNQFFSNYPNPFNPSTTISLLLSQSSHVQYTIFNLKGEKIIAKDMNLLNRGFYEFNIDMSRYSSGVYFYQFIIDDNINSTNKMVLLK